MPDKQEDKQEDNQEKPEDKIKLQQEEIDRLKSEKSRLEGSVKTFEKSMDILKTMQTPGATAQPVQQWTEEQWSKFEEENGVTRNQLKIWSELSKAEVDKVIRKTGEELKKYDDIIKAQQEKISSFEKTNQLNSAKKDLYEKKPELLRYQKDIDEFLADYPEETRNNPEKFAKLIAKAETFIKGKVAEKGGKVPKFNKDSGEPEPDEKEELESRLHGLRDYEKMTMRRVNHTKEESADLKKYEHPLMGDKGIQISERERFVKAREDMKARK